MISDLYIRNPRSESYFRTKDMELYDRYELRCNIPCYVCKRQLGLLTVCPVCGSAPSAPRQFEYECECGCIVITCGDWAGRIMAGRIICGIAIPKMLADMMSAPEKMM